ncbi:hypothetical protein [Streptomyces sp. NBC_01800]|uniref:hypothetical protein n=1 Tax=Streptomyces sp. NBC_01800 TaxID=2975945 RepID=UPI002DD8C311|nr:hypothetical protein [Streptomyces sp. NBC_01800]WSA73019.1 hypothetical protein OIE65_42625 [Streptomyces sp. NBC_01800]
MPTSSTVHRPGAADESARAGRRGTFNHFAGDLGNQALQDVARAIRAGDAVTADVGRALSSERPGTRPGKGGAGRLTRLGRFLPGRR